MRHRAFNDLIWRAVSKADIPATKVPLGLLRTDGKRPDGVTLLPRKNGRCATWNVTVTDTMAVLPPQHISYTIAAETMGAINSDGLEFLGDLGRRITQVTDDIRESAFLFQRLSALIQPVVKVVL